jgi:hypothetical protein
LYGIGRLNVLPLAEGLGKDTENSALPALRHSSVLAHLGALEYVKGYANLRQSFAHLVGVQSV